MEGNISKVPVTQKVQPEVKDVSQTPQQSPVTPQTPSNPTPPPNPKKRLKTKILIALIISLTLIGLGIGGFFVYKSFFVPKEEEVYKGVWMPFLGASLLPDYYLPERMRFLLKEPVFSDLDKAEEAGINTLAFGVGYWANEQGDISMLPEVKEFVISYIDEAHARGFKIWLVLGIAYLSASGEDDPRVIPDEIIENTDFMETFDSAIVEWAKIAQEHNVEFFSPLSEAYVNLGREKSKRWLVEIESKIDAVYSGKICAKGEWPIPELLSSYSCFSADIKIPKNEEEKNRLINHLEQENEKDIEMIMMEVYEGHDWQGTPPEEMKRGFVMALEAARGRVSGIFILDITRPTPLFPESFEKTIKEFYTQEF